MARFNFLFFLLLVVQISVTAQSKPPNILIINSYHRSNPMSDNFLSGIETQLKKSFPNLNLYFEDMDAKRYQSSIAVKLLRDRIELKYAGKVDFSLILAVDNDALDFIVANRTRYFNDIPVVFCGINNFSPAMLHHQKKITGIPETIDIQGTISLILQVQPQVRSIIALTDSTLTGKLLLNEFREAKEPFESSGILFPEYSDLSTDEMSEKLKYGDDNTAILLLTFQKDRTGRTLTFKERTTLLEESKSSVYSFYDYIVGYGVTGGSVLSGSQHGQYAAEIATHIIKGESADNFPVLSESPTVAMFDYRLMERHHIREASLPRGSIVINKPFSFFDTYHTYILIVFGVMLLLILLITFLIRNIVRRQKAERELAEEHERLFVTIASIGDAVISTDINGRIVLMNKVAEDLTGCNFTEAYERELSEVFCIISETSRQKCANPVELVLRTQKVVELENHTILIAKDGREIVISDSAAPIIDMSGKINGVVLVFRDITLKQRMEQSLQKLQRIQSIGFLAGGIAHDFNNYLTGIIGNISLLKSDLAGSPDLLEMLCEAEQAALRATGLTQQLLTFSKGGVPVVRESYIRDLIRENAIFNLRGSNITCVFDIPDDLWMVNVDTGQISQVIANLVINSREAMNNGGEIIIRAHNITLTDLEIPPLRKGNYIKIEIEDLGRGIPESVLPLIFDPYFSTKSTGSGLGLAVVYSIIGNHKGHIEAISRNEKGAIFRIYLPAFMADSSLRETNRELAGCGSARILLMDDDLAIRNSGKKMLTTLGCSATTVASGEEALEEFIREKSGETPYSVVIMDLTVPGKMGGRELIQKIREIDPNVKAIVTSRYSNDPVMADYRKYGFDAVLSKPYSMESLQDIISNIVP